MEFSVTFLGVSAASINPYRPTSTCLIEKDDTKIIVDAGFGILGQLRRIAVNAEEINAVLITHWHFDHFAGLPALLKSRSSTHPVIICGPPPPIEARVYFAGLLGSKTVKFEAVQIGFSREFADLRVRAVPTIHGNLSFGWAIAERNPLPPFRERRIVISGDTRPTQAVIEAAEEADLLIHEATYPGKNVLQASKRGHSTVTDAANVAITARVGALALTHISYRNSKLTARKEAEKIFPNVMVPSCLDRIFIIPLSEGTKIETSGWGNINLATKLSGKTKRLKK